MISFFDSSAFMTPADAEGSHASKIKRAFIERVVTSFLDIIVMTHFKDRPFSGYDVLVFVQKRFGLLLSPGTVYSRLYSMEREGLIKSVAKRGRKRIYRLTDLGKLTVEVATSMNEVKSFFARIFEQ